MFKRIAVKLLAIYAALATWYGLDQRADTRWAVEQWTQDVAESAYKAQATETFPAPWK